MHVHVLNNKISDIFRGDAHCNLNFSKFSFVAFETNQMLKVQE